MYSVLGLAFPALLCASSEDGAAIAPYMFRSAAAFAAPRARTDSLEAAYASGQTWAAFYDGVNRRRELWVRNWTNARVAPDILERARAAGPWRILVITEPGCSDSANSIPYIARLVAETPGLELRLVNSTAGRPWMEAHRTTDGRAATPTILVLDDAYRIRGCWIEQPVKLQAFWLPVVARGAMSEEVAKKMAWYAEDAGRETLREFVEVLEGARSGNVICPGLR
ncbi:MAG TPA: thioredoxin family protein [Gemmatimonadaceae bacterium]|nr:thioredoxin family protein [Gemmatimonadaceae bacterium]